MRAHIGAFIYNDDTNIRLHQLDDGHWVLSFDDLSIFMEDNQVSQLLSAIGKIYWDLDSKMELVDPEEDCYE